MAKYKILVNGFGPGINAGDEVTREPHAMTEHLRKGEAELVDESQFAAVPKEKVVDLKAPVAPGETPEKPKVETPKTSTKATK